MSIEIEDRDVGVAVHQPFRISVLENVRCDKTSNYRGRNGSTNFVREETKDEHADDCPSESGGRQNGTIVVVVELLSVDP